MSTTSLYQRLGASNLRVSRLCLGAMMFGGATDKAESGRIVASARERGLNFIDTADIYNQGASEEVVGELLDGQRDSWVLATKIGNAARPDIPNESRYSRQWLVRGVENSLRRLRTDYIDILYLHRDFHRENLEETALALGDLIRAGKIRSFGLSNFRGWRIAEMVHLCRQLHVPQPVVLQPCYNLLNRGPEVEVLPACEHYGLGVVPYSPIARGVLTGKYQPGAQPDADTRMGRGDVRIRETEFREESLAIAQTIAEHALRRGVNPGQFATAWVLANPIVTSVIAGPRTLAQMEDYYGALDIAISPEEEAMVDALVSPGHPSTPGYNDPGHPFYGRPV
ncbi:aldo/keto reductase [Paracandidimonas soli]|uniref:aldo/keto reductase n=1 Tax=Paracandidimonas soli TaxID=1917182 RepID=UPI00334117AC